MELWNDRGAHRLGRSFEGRNGERIVAWFKKTIPADARVESSSGD